MAMLLTKTLDSITSISNKCKGLHRFLCVGPAEETKLLNYRVGLVGGFPRAANAATRAAVADEIAD